MTDVNCDEMRLLVQADADGELEAGQAALVAAHVAGCEDCARLRDEMTGLRAGLREALPYHAPSAELRARLAGLVAAPEAPRAVVVPFRRRWLAPAGGFAAGAALAAGLALAVVLPRPEDLTGALVADHVRALQPGHLMDVVSTDEHTVKPWLDARLDFAPPVKDLAAQGFPLEGGRLDYLDGRTVAAMVYRHRLHPIDLYVWPIRGARDAAPELVTRDGWHVVRWTRDGMAYRAVSDLAAPDLMRFVALWEGA